MFIWGSKTLLDETNHIVFRGKEICVIKVNGKILLKADFRPNASMKRRSGSSARWQGHSNGSEVKPDPNSVQL